MSERSELQQHGAFFAAKRRSGEALTGATLGRKRSTRHMARRCASERAQRAPAARRLLRREAAKRSLVPHSVGSGQPVTWLVGAPVSERSELQQHGAAKPSVGIVTDSACDLPADLATKLGIEIVPLSIRFGNEELVDREELTTAEFWDRCATSPELPSTAAPSPGRFEQAYRHLADCGATSIVAVCLSGALSATLQSAELAARSVSGDIDVRVVDSRTVSLGLGTIAIACAERAAAGAQLDEIEQLASTLVDRTRVFGALDTLDNLKRGGRIGNAKALLATALSIKPIIEVADGVVEQHGKQRTRSKALAFLVDKVASYAGRMEHLAVLHADCSDVDDFVAKLRPFAPADIVVGQIGPVIGAHAGRGTIGVAFQETA